MGKVRNNRKGRDGERRNERIAPPDHARIRQMLLALEQYRVQRGWSFNRLSQDMHRRGFGLPQLTLYRLVRLAPDDVNPHAKTLHRIEKYLDSALAA